MKPFALLFLCVIAASDTGRTTRELVGTTSGLIALFLPPDFLGQVNSMQWQGKHLLKDLGLLLLGSTITPKKVNPVKRDFHVSRSIKLIAEVEYKTIGWKLSFDRRTINFTDGFEAGSFKLWGTRDLHEYQLKQIKRVRVVRRADGYYCQFCNRSSTDRETRANRQDDRY